MTCILGMNRKGGRIFVATADILYGTLCYCLLFQHIPRSFYPEYTYLVREWELLEVIKSHKVIQIGVANSEKGLSSYANSKSLGHPVHSYTDSQTGLRCSQIC